MKNKYIIWLIVMIMLPLISASISNLGTFGQGDCVSLRQTCEDCTYVNITSVVQPDGNKALSVTEMTKTGTEYNYTFCSTNLLGKYIVSGIGDLGGELQLWQYEFNVTSDGEEIELWLIVLLIFTGIVIYTLIYRKNRFVGSLMFMGLGLGIWAKLGNEGNNWIGAIVFIVALISMIYEMINVLGEIKKNRSST